jgi:hypothetical protein
MSKESVKINISRKQLAAKLRTLVFKEEEVHIVYLPGFKISGYGETIEEAYELAKLSLRDFADNLFKLPESKIYQTLRELGWEKDKYLKKQMRNLSETTFEDIKREFNIPDNTPIHESSLSV